MDGHGHAHHGPGRALAIGLALTLAFAAAEVVGGLLSGSLALIADAGHMLVDSAGLMMALAATLIARRPSDLKRTYGYARAEVLVVPVHVLLMAGVAAYIVFEAIRRFGNPPEIEGWPVLAVGTVGLALNLLVFRLLSPHGQSNLNARAALLEVAMDALGSVGVILSAVVVLLTGWAGVDIIVSLVIAALVVPRAVVLLRHAVSILLESAPQGIDTASIEADAKTVQGVRALHDLHVWSLAPSFVALSAHVEVDSMDGCSRQLADLTRILRDRHGIVHVTLQPETRELHEAIDCCQFPDAQGEHIHAAAH